MNGISLEYKDDYVQSANTLFHFVNRFDYLIDALKNRALIPRYCIEDIGYMGLNTYDNKAIKEIAVLQKCFCDIPFHKLTDRFDVSIVNKIDLNEDVANIVNEAEFNTHPGCYGKYALAFYKLWGEKNGLIPVQYVNEKSHFISNLKSLFEHIEAREDVDELFVNDLIERMAFMKPLRGTMPREINGHSIIIEKNFHDEREWRYVPSNSKLESVKLDRIIIKKSIRDNLQAINNNIRMMYYEPIWLKFDYNEIKYIIVPDYAAREELIRNIVIMFENESKASVDSYILASKILVLDDIRKDW